MQRFCNDKFCESFSTTIGKYITYKKLKINQYLIINNQKGVDFQVRSMMIDNRVIALQVCDTVIEFQASKDEYYIDF